MTNPANFRARLAHLVPNAISVACPYPIARGEGSLLYTTDGRRLIDFAAGIAVMGVGHAHPKVTRAIQQAAENFTHVCFQVMGYDSYLDLAERLTSTLPAGPHWKCAFFNSGAEAVENAMKIARAYTKRTTFLSFEHAFHGRTYGALSLTGKPGVYKAGFGPFVPEVVQVSFPSGYRCIGCDCVARGAIQSPSNCTATTIARIEQVFASRVPANEVAAIFIEPIVGEGGFYIPPEDFLPALRALCDRRGILLIVDEIQTGVCRTGTFWRFAASGVVPDIVLTAKAIAGGMPLSGVLGKAEILDAVHPGGIGGTYGGNPIAIAAAHAVLDIVAEENLCEQARTKGEYVMGRLREWRERFSSIGDVRGAGLMCAMEFVKDRPTKEPYKEIVPKIISRCYENGLALLSAGTYSNCIRLVPALNIPDAILREGMDVLETAISEATDAQ